jgi:hypothetical protein
VLVILPGSAVGIGNVPGTANELGSPRSAQSDDALTATYMVCPVLTDLQRKNLDVGTGLEARAYVRINGNAVIKPSGEIDEKALNMQGIARALAPHSDKKNGCVYFEVVYISAPQGPAVPSNESQLALSKRLQNHVKNLGFAASQFRTQSKGTTKLDDWADTLEQVKAAQGALPDGPESSIGNHLVRVYPIRSVLSRLLSDNADCRVEILPLVDGSQPNPLTPEIRAAISQYVAKLELRQKQKINFVLQYEYGRGNAAIDKMLKTIGKEVKPWLGFAQVVTTTTAVTEKAEPKTAKDKAKGK